MTLCFSPISPGISKDPNFRNKADFQFYKKT